MFEIDRDVTLVLVWAVVLLLPFAAALLVWRSLQWRRAKALELNRRVAIDELRNLVNALNKLSNDELCVLIRRLQDELSANAESLSVASDVVAAEND